MLLIQLSIVAACGHAPAPSRASVAPDEAIAELEAELRATPAEHAFANGASAPGELEDIVVAAVPLVGN